MQEEYKGYLIRIDQDETADDPRKMYDHLGTMACAHRKYELGDEKAPWSSKEEAVEFFRKEEAVWLPLFLFDHSGLRISTSDEWFRAWDPQGWDWGLVGWIYAPKAKILKEFQRKKMSQKLVRRALEVLESEVETYDTWLSGAVVQWTVEDSEGEFVDGVCGYYSNEHCLQDARLAVDALVQEQMGQKKNHENMMEVCR